MLTHLPLGEDTRSQKKVCNAHTYIPFNSAHCTFVIKLNQTVEESLAQAKGSLLCLLELVEQALSLVCLIELEQAIRVV